MKLWTNFRKTKPKRACVCGKDNAKVRVNTIQLKRRLVLGSIGLTAWVAAMLVDAGTTLSLAFRQPLIPIMLGIWFAIFLVEIVYRMATGHSLRCSLRRAAFSAL